MKQTRTLLVVFVVAVGVASSACGGGGGPLGDAPTQIRVSSTALPGMVSGQRVDHVIPLTGGCGGPYIFAVIDGKLPPGLHLDSETNTLCGTLLASGVYDFVVQVTDRGCTPHTSTTAAFHMEVGVGDMVVVDVLLDGAPGLIPAGAESFNPDYPALPTVVYNDFVSLTLQVAGGQPPYTMDLYDDPEVPNDGPLPLGTSVPPNSIAIVGAPIQVGSVNGAFLNSYRVRDSVGRTIVFTAYWRVNTPPIILASESLANGQAGVTYSEQFYVVEGVPPFRHEFVEQGLPPNYTSDVGPNPANPNADVIYNPGAPPTVKPPEAMVRIDAGIYPAETDLGPDYAATSPGAPPEGIRLFEQTGNLSGIPRRRGTFLVHYHVQSSLVPYSAGQHAWGSFTFSIGAAPAIQQNPAYTLATSFPTTPPYAEIAQAEQGVVYNPDGGPAGLQLLADGGVPQDGYEDAPHDSQAAAAPLETEGEYKWEIDWDPDGEGNSAIPFMELLLSGVFKSVDGEENSLSPQFDQALGFKAIDFALPSQLATTSSEKVRFSIGPDRVIVTQSNTSYTVNSYDNRPMNDTALTLKVLIPRPTGDLLRSPNDSDLVGAGTGKIQLPSEAGSSTTLASLLTNMDMTRVSINPTGWWDDVFHLNPRAARPFQHGDRNSAYAYYGLTSYGTTSTPSTSYGPQYQWQPTAVALRIPETPTVAPNRNNGVYNDGGKLYIFETDTHLGIFIIRKDGRLYVPAAFHKSATGWYSFGDNWTEGRKSPGSSNSCNKIPQMTVSPDGRFGALKLRSSTSYNQYEYADDSAILLLSLTGERISAWGDKVYKVIGTGSNGSTSQGQYQFASSLTLTNQYLYYLIGSGSSSTLYWRDHYIYRYDLFSGNTAGALLHSNFSSNWTNSSGNAMQTPFQDYYDPFDLYGGPDEVMYTSNGYNCNEVSLAPHPFRVNADGNACAILAGITYSGSYGYQVMHHHVWIDYEGSLHQLSSTGRRTTGGGRGCMLQTGPMYYPCAWQWGSYDGPTSRFEISDDGLKVAVAYKRVPVSTSSSYGYYAPSYSTYQYHYRSDIAAYATTAASAWATHTTHEITGDSSTSTSPSGCKFSSPHTWRFGALTFTADGDGLVFWGGYSNYGPSTTYMGDYYMYYGCKSYVGSIYSYDFTDKSVRNILSTSDGGCNKTVGSAFTSTSFSTSSWQSDGGVIKPWGGFLSKNRNFLYIRTRGALSSSDYRDNQLLGVNIRSLDTSQSINGRTDGRAFKLTGWGTYDSCFGDAAYYAHMYGMGYYYNYPGYCGYMVTNHGGTLAGTATENGWVFFVSSYGTGSYSSSTSSSYGGALNYTYYVYPYHPKKLYVFDPNVGGDIQLIESNGAWSGSSYTVVGGLEVADDGSAAAAVYSTSAYYSYNDRERLRTWTNIELDADGDLVGTPVKYDLETSGHVSSHVAFGTKVEDLYYAQGASNENGKSLKTGHLATGTTSTYAFTAANYNVLHVGR